MTKTRSSMKILACLMAVVAVLCSFAISASAMEPGVEYTPELSGLPASHSASDIFDGSAEVTEDGEYNVVTLTVKSPIVIMGQSGEIDNITLNGSSDIYKVEYANHQLVITCPIDISVEDFAVPLTLDISMTMGSHVGGVSVNSTLTLSK